MVLGDQPDEVPGWYIEFGDRTLAWRSALRKVRHFTQDAVVHVVRGSLRLAHGFNGH